MAWKKNWLNEAMKPWRIRIRMPYSWFAIYHQYTPVLLAYIPYIRILWEWINEWTDWLNEWMNEWMREWVKALRNVNKFRNATKIRRTDQQKWLGPGKKKRMGKNSLQHRSSNRTHCDDDFIVARWKSVAWPTPPCPVALMFSFAWSGVGIDVKLCFTSPKTMITDLGIFFISKRYGKVMWNKSPIVGTSIPTPVAVLL